MLLEINTSINGYTPEARIDSGTLSYREVYRARIDGTDNLVMLIACAKNLAPLSPSGEVVEFGLRKALTGDVFPKVTDTTAINIGANEIELMALPWIDCRSLREIITRKGPMPWKMALPLFSRIFAGVREIASVTSGGGHYAINPDNIYIYTDRDRVLSPLVCGLGNAGPAVSGAAAPVPDPGAFWIAPECFDGKYSEASDLFALALLLVYMIEGKNPVNPGFDPAGMSPAEFRAKYEEYLDARQMKFYIPGDLKYLLMRMLTANADLRVANAGLLQSQISRIMEKEEMKPYVMPEEKTTEPSEKSDSDTDGDKPEKTDDDEDREKFQIKKRPEEGQIKLQIQRVEGNGFSDVVGLDSIKRRFNRNFISIVRNADLAKAYCIEPPNGILLWGPPGNGKTFISRKLAEESGLLYAQVNPSDIGSIYVHGTQGLIGELFARCEKMAKKEKTGVLLCFEEFDTMVPNRAGQGVNNRNDEVAEFLTRLNNCAEKGVYVLATTNRIDAIDPAVMRKGRIDDVIYVGLPDRTLRSNLFRMELEKRPHDDIDYDTLAQLTDGFTSGDISFLVKEAARKTFEKAVDAGATEPVGITQNLVELTIKENISSVTSSERNYYEKLRNTYGKNRQNAAPVGFATKKSEN